VQSHGLEVSVPVDLVIEDGEPARRLGELARREDRCCFPWGRPARRRRTTPMALSIFVWVMIGMAFWHFSVLVARPRSCGPANGRLYPWPGA
jgi:hypothetical protein